MAMQCQKQGLKTWAGPLSSGLDHTLDCFCLDRTAQWTARYSNFLGGGVKNKGLSTGPDHRLDHFFLDWTTHWTAFVWTGTKWIGPVHFSGPICNWTGPQT